MKKLCACLLLVLMPIVAMGDMVGYSGDTRRYVTEEEKTQFPYNTVVSFPNPGGTGTFVSEDVILTCRHVIKDIGKGNKIDYLMTDGRQGSGLVAPYMKDEKKMYDYGLVVSMGAFNGRVLDVSPQVPLHSNNLMVIGYDSLKPLSKDELKIVKEEYEKLSKKYGTINSDNAGGVAGELEAILYYKYACRSDTQTNCVKCKPHTKPDDWGCIFQDSDNMKVRFGCKITRVGNRIETNCPGAPGLSGAAIIDRNMNKIIGIYCSGIDPQIGQEQDATSAGVRSDIYYEDLKDWIEKVRKKREELRKEKNK